ncbi:MAG: hypothetical protein K6A65_06820 [Succinivibrionaceae bacterium]|nr:hypothetical protein [Succinivibrionaceae bacterium]
MTSEELEQLRQERRRRLKKRHIFICSVVLTVVLTALIIIFPTNSMAVFCGVLICVFFCIGAAYQRAIVQLLILSLACIGVVWSFYMLFTPVASH